MIQLKTWLGRLGNLLLMLCIVALSWLPGAMVPEVAAMPTIASYHTLSPILELEATKTSKRKRAKRILACLPKDLGTVQQDLEHQIQANSDNLKLTTLNTIFDLTSHPELRRAKYKFISCLDNKRLLPRTPQ